MQTTDRTARLLEVVDHIYEAALKPDLWSCALGALARLLDVRAAGIRVETTGMAVQQTWVGLDATFEQAYVSHYWRDDPWAEPLYRAPVGTVGYGEQLVPRARVMKSAFYNDLARPYDLDDLGGGILERTPTRAVSFGAMKGRGHAFRAEHGRLLARIAPHLRRSLEISARLDAVAGRRAGSNPIAPPEQLASCLRRAHGLTAAEAEVAILVAQGMSPKEVATRRGTSWYTVRAQLRQILDKTQLPNQRALAHAVTRMEGGLAHDFARGSVRSAS